MVDADDRPCETSIGNWWVPGDFAWQEDLDAEDLTAATPLMDRCSVQTGEEPKRPLLFAVADPEVVRFGTPAV